MNSCRRGKVNEEVINDCKKCHAKKTSQCPIVVKVQRVDEDECGKPCHMHISGVHRFPNISTEGPVKRDYDTECETCLEIIRRRDILLYEKERQKLKIISDFLTNPRNSEITPPGPPCDACENTTHEHNYKELLEKERELMRKERELASLKYTDCEDICYTAARQKQLEIRWKEFELQRQRPNLLLRNLEKAKDNIQEYKDKHCFTQLEKKERALKRKEKAVDAAIEKLRKHRYYEEMDYLKGELEERLRLKAELKKNIEVQCACNCAAYNELIETIRRSQEKASHDACSYIPIGGYVQWWSPNTMNLLRRTAHCPQHFGNPPRDEHVKAFRCFGKKRYF